MSVVLCYQVDWEASYWCFDSYSYIYW